MEEKSLAMEMLEELKRSNKRWFIIAVVELLIIVSMIIGFLIYESQYDKSYTDETIQTVDSSDIDNSYITQY